jgi:anti-sigma regulatory factor (Ser/Thr protein kinase)
MTSDRDANQNHDPTWRILTEFTLPGVPGDEREAQDRVVGAVQALRLSTMRLQGLKTAVAEAVLKFIAHGQHQRAEGPEQIRVCVSGAQLAIAAGTSEQDGEAIPGPPALDLAVKLDDPPLLHGWGFFLVEKMADDPRSAPPAARHTLELYIYPEGDQRGAEQV